MKTEKMKLSELTTQSRGYSVFVRVMKKSEPKMWCGGKLVYQTVIVEDDQGDTMRAVVFGDRVEYVQERLSVYGWYEIVNAPVIASDTPWRSGPNELSFQLHLSSSVEIRCLAGPPEMRFTRYQSISDIMKRGVGAMNVDVLGVVLYVAEKTGSITTADGHVTITRDIVLTDFSCDMPVFVTALDQLAMNGCPAINLSAPDFIVISFNDMVASSYKGFYLTTSATTCVSQYPIGEMPDKLRNWAAENKCVLVTRRNKLLAYLGLPIVRSVEPIRSLAKRTVFNTRRADCFWLKVIFKDIETQHINAYVGCSNCEGPTTITLGNIYQWMFCFQKFCQARPCLNFNATLVDETGGLSLKLMTAQTEALFSISAAEIYEPKIRDKTLQIQGISAYLECVPRYVRVFAEHLESYYPWVAWKVIDIELMDSSVRLEAGSCASTIREIGSSSGTVPALPEAVVKAVSDHDDLCDAEIDYKPPFTFI